MKRRLRDLESEAQKLLNEIRERREREKDFGPSPELQKLCELFHSLVLICMNTYREQRENQGDLNE